ncbi:RagB/SusD family nutrient uptake outer membrane protein [Ilyomonas limi]|uniref:RagB/SusD family nutrient uptake outer membrane protein n=1 Tax=Ilyomonas limi TaxID=2575867 RepID=A0A4V5UTY0_9BACT|nr:RagB/SusD family nutrient uptake outer membrane protein [Ilyomonas limi]TKK66913.1 RagB/SusD family nutrient uptake outer membrane protein [Ilyomonas limi]
MKKRNFLIIVSVILVTVFIIVACSKSFLDKPPLGTLNPQIMASEKGVQGILIGAYSMLDGNGAAGDGNYGSAASNWGYGGVAADDAYKGSDPSDVSDFAPFEDWTVTATNGALPQKWTACYAGIQRSNDVLRTMALATDITPEVQTQITAQARFLRAWYHMELKKVFNNIPYADENVDPQHTDVTNTEDVWPKIEADLQFAVDNLPETWGSEVGRANVWAAKAVLAKAYMFEKKYSAAYPVLQDIIANGKTAGGAKYALMPHYFSNFNPAQKNSAESVFAAQTSVQDGSSVDWGGDPNGNYGDILNFPYTGGPGACCGFYNPSQDLANAFKTDANTGLPLLDNWYEGLNVSAESGTSYSGTLDPRIDWTMGRPGIPYLDWGLHPGLDWIRNPANDGNKSPLKNVYAASQKDQYTDVGSAYWGPTELVANNVNLIRFADVILWAAECAADAGDLAAATTYVNQVRSRMKDHPEAWVYKNSDYDAASAVYTNTSTPAANYKIGLYPTFASKDFAVKAIHFERRLELAMEGHRFFDLVRWGEADQVLNAYYERERPLRPLKKDAHWTPGKNEYFPIPQSAIDNMNSDGTQRLTQNPGY